MKRPFRLPIRLFTLQDSLKGYSWKKAKADGTAAANVALLDFPQGMAYALIAGLPVQFGIFCSALASLLGPLFASSRFVMLGPTNATAVMLLSTFLTLGYSPGQAMTALPLLMLMVGAFMILGSFVGVGGLVRYVSRSVITGYISAAAFLIIVNQLKTTLGLEVPRSGTFIESLWILLQHISGTHLPSLLIALATLAIYLPLKGLWPRIPNVAITLILISAGVQFAAGWIPFEVAMLSPINATEWPLTLPSLEGESFAVLANAALAIAFLAMLECSSISKTLAAQAGDRINLNQQLYSMGIVNTVCGCASGMPVSGSLTRSVLNFKSGARTALSSMMSGSLLLAGLFLLGGLVGFIPKPALAMLVITVGLSLLNRGQIQVMLKTTRSDASVFAVTFFSGLVFALDTAIYLGTAASFILFLRKAANPELKEIQLNDGGELVESELDPHRKKRPKIAIVHVEGDLFFAASDIFLDQMRNFVAHPDLKVVILRLRNALHLDASIALAIRELITFANENGRHVLVSGAHDEVERVFRNSGVMQTLGEDRFFRFNPDNPNISTRDALKKAQEIMGTESADITIFAKEK